MAAHRTRNLSRQIASIAVVGAATLGALGTSLTNARADEVGKGRRYTDAIATLDLRDSLEVATADGDGDGFADWAERFLRTDPSDPAQVPEHFASTVVFDHLLVQDLAEPGRDLEVTSLPGTDTRDLLDGLFGATELNLTAFGGAGRYGQDELAAYMGVKDDLSTDDLLADILGVDRDDSMAAIVQGFNTLTADSFNGNAPNWEWYGGGDGDDVTLTNTSEGFVIETFSTKTGEFTQTTYKWLDDYGLAPAVVRESKTNTHGDGTKTEIKDGAGNVLRETTTDGHGGISCTDGSGRPVDCNDPIPEGNPSPPPATPSPKPETTDTTAKPDTTTTTVADDDYRDPDADPGTTLSTPSLEQIGQALAKAGWVFSIDPRTDELTGGRGGDTDPSDADCGRSVQECELRDELAGASMVVMATAPGQPKGVGWVSLPVNPDGAVGTTPGDRAPGGGGCAENGYCN